MFRKIYQAGSSRKQAPIIAIREPDLEPPREALVRPCQWTLDQFMVHASFKEEFDVYVQNAGLEDFVSDKCRQYLYLTDSFARRLSLHPRAILTLFYLIFMINHIPWTY